MLSGQDLILIGDGQSTYKVRFGIDEFRSTGNFILSGKGFDTYLVTDTGTVQGNFILL